MSTVATLYMTEAIELAERGRGSVHPNPLVGAVVLRDGHVVGRGFHAKFGGVHAEIAAISDAGGEGSCQGAELFVTLEPCAHHGKTPPCTDAIIRAGFRRVVFAVDDPDPLVSGAGRRVLEAAGIVVESGILVDRATEQNRAYLRHRRTGLPFVTWKMAKTLDGRMTLVRGKRTAITGEESWKYVRELRSKVDAVAIGIETSIIDDPRLRGVEGARNPRRIVFDSRARLPLKSNLVCENEDRSTIVVTTELAPPRSRDALRAAGVEVIEVRSHEGRVDLEAALRLLAERGILDILLESGPTLGEAFRRSKLLQREILIEAPIRGDRRVPLTGARMLGEDRLTERVLG